MSIKLNFNKLLEARNKAHFKRLDFLTKGQIDNSNKFKFKIDDLSQRIINEIDNH